MIDRAGNIRQIKKLAEDKPPRKSLINKKSEKRKSEEKEYLKLRESFLEIFRTCGAQIECKGNKAVDVHHKRGRGKYYLVPMTWLAVCRKCHTWITLNSKSAIVKGLSISRLNSGSGDLSPTLIVK